MRWTNSRSSSEGESTFLNGSPESCDAIICAHKKCGLLYDAAPFASEFMGTFVLCLTVSLSSGLENFADLAVGASLMAGVFMGGHISGAHHNPAVTLAIWLTGYQKKGMFGMGSGQCACLYVAVQLLGSLVAGLVS
mmetsp:Transcript_32113/g.61811  ORF Transcript_32113/g.61811 Transcript_32113/m.61811 type:complete len:136 (-) Transcript_32113:10-417(-)